MSIGISIKIIIIFVLLSVCCFAFWNKREHFWFIRQGMHMCNSFADLDRTECLKCANAGYCTLPNGEKQCISGNIDGRYDESKDCQMWEYGGNNNYVNLSLIDPPQPYFVEPNRYWDFTDHLRTPREEIQPTPDGQLFSKHGSPPQEHHRKLI